MHFVRAFIFSGLQRLPATSPITLRTPPARFFSVYPCRKAAEIPNAKKEALKNSETFQRISNSPAALSAIQKLAEVMQNSGIDLGTKPSTLQMLKLATDSKFREASKNVVQEFQSAGVDLTSKDVMEELQSIAKEIVTTPKPEYIDCISSDSNLQFSNGMAVIASNSVSPQTQERPLPQVTFYSVEYPGYVRESSVPFAIQKIGGQSKLDNALRRSAQRKDALLELSFRPNDPFAHPIPGDVVPANNLLLKVVKRRRRPCTGSKYDVIGEFTAEIVGIVSKTARFRSMADYQYLPDIKDPVTKLRMAMSNMDVDGLRSYTIPAEPFSVQVPPSTSQAVVPTNLDPELVHMSLDPLEGPSYVRSLRAFPPPLFSRQGIPQGYNFRANTASVITTTTDEETGEERKRMINRMRWKGYGPASVMFSDNQVPGKPPPAVDNQRGQVSDEMFKKLEDLFEKRPIWTRMSLLNQFSAMEAREIVNSKILLPLCCYVFQDGPWRDTLIRFSYDPRRDPESRFYQRIYFRNANHPISRPSVTSRRQDRLAANDHRNLDQDAERRLSHIFDGKTLTKETAAFQICDIADPMLKSMIENPETLRESCDERDGWYTSHAFEQIKTVLRHKFFSLLEGHSATDDDCRALLTTNEGSAKAATAHRSSKLRPGKHNMAKGALRPEDAAALRLRAALDRNIKSFQSRS